jgi:transcriptional regulator with XRE-family HTH domain
MPMTGDLLQAARVLTGLSVNDLAGKCGLSPKTIGRLEDRGDEELDVGPVTQDDTDTLRKLRRVLEEEGVEFLEDGTPGVRLRPSAVDEAIEESVPVDEVTAANDT